MGIGIGQYWREAVYFWTHSGMAGVRQVLTPIEEERLLSAAMAPVLKSQNVTWYRPKYQRFRDFALLLLFLKDGLWRTEIAQIQTCDLEEKAPNCLRLFIPAIEGPSERHVTLSVDTSAAITDYLRATRRYPPFGKELLFRSLGRR